MKLQIIYTLLLLSITIIIISIYLYSTGENEQFAIIDNLNNCENIYTNNNSYVAEWEYDGSILGKGKNATVYGGYGIINGKKVNVAIKVIDYVSYDKFLKEVSFQIKAASNYLAPNVYDAFICENTGYIVTSKIDKTVSEYLETFAKGSKEQMDMFDLLKEKATNLLIDSNNASLLHTDRHIDNFGVILNDKSEPTLVLIDWDAASNVKLNESSMIDVLRSLDLTFKLLKSNLLTPSSLHKFKVPEAPTKKRIPQPRTELKPKSSSSLSFSTFSEPKIQSNLLNENANTISPIRFSSFGSIEDNNLSPFSSPVKMKDQEEEEQKYESPFKIRKINRNLFDEEDD